MYQSVDSAGEAVREHSPETPDTHRSAWHLRYISVVKSPLVAPSLSSWPRILPGWHASRPALLDEPSQLACSRYELVTQQSESFESRFPVRKVRPGSCSNAGGLPRLRRVICGMCLIRIGCGWFVHAHALHQLSCASTSRTKKGAVIGAVVGGVAGGVVGGIRGSTAKARHWAVVGGAAGALIGRQMDKQANELKQNIPGAPSSEWARAYRSRSSRAFCSRSTRRHPRNARSNLSELAASLEKYDGSI